MSKAVAYIIATILMVLFYGALLVGMYFLAGYQCRSKFADFENRYSFSTHCQIKIHGKWVPSDNYRAL